MKNPITMPVLSDTMQTGRLTRWNKSVGDAIKKGEAVAEVETDKAVLDVEAFADGFLAGPLAATDTDIPVRQVIGYIVDQKEAPATPAAPEPHAAVADAAPVPEPEPAARIAAPGTANPVPVPSQAIPSAPTRQNTGTISPKSGDHADGALISPYARALAADLNLDIRQITPGADGVIHASQVLAAALAPQDADLRMGPPYQIEKPSALRAAVARNMSATLQTPTFLISSRFNLSALHASAKTAKLSFTLALGRACALTVAEDPWFNQVWTRQGLAKRQRVDLGIAVDTGEGLVTPVLRDAARRTLPELAEDWRILLGKVKKGRVTPNDYQGASFYLSNLGIFPEIERFNAIVPTGAAAILAVAAADSDGLTDFTLSCDHRVIFGADAARFLQRLGKRLEDLSWLT
ncbi:dihydrolipoamide acetyltransferase family protein [Acidithiobacillus thiooxidans]|uniref:Dihydrolipoamide acetyltransferase component of pyruvate dehydrogenase complex n=1 Tax=Acidithiobacillus thiooxidans ATCC 19377 TaxID=637390 RepID=A0A543Q2K3_ACITH|nr:dihydrolipoamide acetyltransferase family protein [Acidithiobacillus thiooxidans]MDR7927592.1 dihydrolipoamide acetyltransferase family protein [Acidithiobacillus thiooxidans]MDX5935345.1 dihydrolipoamide acetyltransferase family protein [Acidithiobacillus thiooxidans]TQN50520.1 Dihydrolipoyllysine-residue acetyltransferase component of pyruvate dehydrogenase complex [Acidithiobacillus thiooxidans ATCC 19377]